MSNDRTHDRRVNAQIRVPEVRLIGPDGEQVGVVSLQVAMQRAGDAGMDLVEISPSATPPVCKVMDYGKFRFEEEKRIKDTRKRQKIIKLKEVKFRPITDDHDFDFKVKNGIKFLERGDKVKFTVRFRGREMAHDDLGMRVIDRVREIVQEQIAVIEEKKASFEGRNLSMILAPAKKSAKRTDSVEDEDSIDQDIDNE